MTAVAATIRSRVPTGARAVGLIGVAFGFLAVWLALPPFEVRAPGRAGGARGDRPRLRRLGAPGP